MKEILVIGAGAAGIMAALAAAEAGARVHLFEKNDIVGKKMGITGKGRCNLTNSCSMADFIAHTPGHGKFLYSAYEQFTNQDLLDKLHTWGLATKEERGSRMVVSAASGNYEGDACIITTGGMSYPVTGSTGDGYGFARSLGHSVTELKPSLIPFTTEETWPHTLSGLSLRNVEASLWKRGKKVASHFGEMLFTHFGVSGPIILMLSTEAAHKKSCVFPMQLRIDLKPALSKEKLDARLRRDFEKYIRKEAANGLKDLLPQRLIPIVLDQAGIAAACPVNQISREQRQDLVDTLKALSLTVAGTRPIEEAIVTAGGIAVKEINPKTMESKLVPNLYFAGEVIDIDAFTGGYNLQAAFSTGFVAGTAAATKECIPCEN